MYYLVNRSSGEIDKIGITSNPSGRYSQQYLRTENVQYVPQVRYQSRLVAAADEHTRLTFCQITHGGSLPRLNKVPR